MKDRLHHLDLLETAAMFFVVFYHSTTYFYNFTQDGSAICYLRYFGRTILSVGAPLFFFANGYLLLNRPFDLKKHIRKIGRLLLLRVLWPCILLPIYRLIAGEPLEFRVMLKSILTLDIDWAMNLFWFLEALIAIYVLFPALKALFDRSRKTFGFVTAACAALTMGLVFLNQQLDVFGALLHRGLGTLRYPFFNNLNPLSASYGYAFVYFCVGGLCRGYEEKLRRIPGWKRNTVSVFGLLACCGGLLLLGIFYSVPTDEKPWDVVWNGYNTVFTFCNVLFIYVLCLNWNRPNALIRAISSNTMGIYLIHTLVIRLTRPTLKTWELACNYPANVVYALGIVLFCLLICLSLRKIPVLKKLI